MSFGSTTDKGDPKKNVVPLEITQAKTLTDKDADMKTLDELRGIATSMEKGYKNLHEAKLSLNEKATVQGVMTEIDVLKQRFEMTHEQMRRLIGMYQTLRGELDEFKQARVRELGMRINGGSTTPEDYDGLDTRPGN